jgi:hypothetical protein
MIVCMILYYLFSKDNLSVAHNTLKRRVMLLWHEKKKRLCCHCHFRRGISPIYYRDMALKAAPCAREANKFFASIPCICICCVSCVFPKS